MSKLMSVLGVILLAVGLVLGLLELMQPGRIQGLGMSLGNALDLIVGGILALGLGGVIDALRGGSMTSAVGASAPAGDVLVPGSSIGKPEVEVAPAPEPVAEEAPAAEEPAPSRMRFGFGKKLGAATTAAAATAEAVAEPAKSNVQDTLDALEQAKQDIKGALGGVESITAPSPTEEPAEAPAEDELYVVEEKMIRGRPARILSDDTVEAETDEGWMRFENLDHLNEYLDAAGQ
jgi:hypothetical protein